MGRVKSFKGRKENVTCFAKPSLSIFERIVNTLAIIGTFLCIMHRLNALVIVMISRPIVPLRAWRFAEVIFGTGGIKGGSQCLHGTSSLRLSREGEYREVLLYVFGVPLCFGSILLR
jgi:hypothetical protein